MYYYHGLSPYVNDETVGLPDWREHHNPVVVLRNPLDRVKSATYLAKGRFNGMSLDPDYPLDKLEKPALSREKEISKRKNLRA
jgi:hypothetical protein